MSLDNEARQEMILEPRSFIPHPRASVIHPSTTTGEARLLSTNQDEPNEELNGSGERRNEDEGEIVKGDEGSTNGSGDEDSVSLVSHNETNTQKQETLLPVDSLTAEPIKSYSSPAAVNSSSTSREALAATANQPKRYIVIPQVNHSESILPQRETKDDYEKQNIEENKGADNNSSMQDSELEDGNDDKINNSAIHQESSAISNVDSEYPSSLDEVKQIKDDGSKSNETVGNALRFSLKSEKPQIKTQSFPEEEKNADSDDENENENESGSGINEEKTAGLNKEKEPKVNNNIHEDEADDTTNQDSKVKDHDKSAEPEEPESAMHTDEVDNKHEDHKNNVDKDDDENDNEDDNEDKQDDDHNTSGSGNYQEIKSQNGPTLGSTKQTSKEDDESADVDDKEDEDKLEDAIDNEKGKQSKTDGTKGDRAHSH
jgi:hypothetical protein